MEGHDLQKTQRTCHIVLIIENRLCHRLAHRLQSGKVDNGINGMLRKDPFHVRFRTDVRLIEMQGDRNDFLDPLQNILFGIGKIVGNDDFLFASLGQLHYRVGTDIPTASGYQNHT